MIDSDMFSVFVKEAGPRIIGGPAAGIKARDLLAAGVGAASLYGAHRVAKDIATGEQVRKQERAAAKAARRGGY